jgi:hypothetical protein
MQKRSYLPDDSSPIFFKVTPVKIVSILAANTLIALFVAAIYPGSSFLITLVYSQCIGISIATCSITAANYVRAPELSIQLAFIALEELHRRD